MSLVDNLRQQRQTPQALWLQFATAYDSKHYTLYIFFEGKTDSAYYLPELRRRRKQREIIQFICDGKDGVIAAYNDKRIRKKITHWKNVLFRPIIAWAIAQKKKEQELAIIQNRKQKGLNLNNINLNKVFELDSDLKPLKKKNAWQNIKKACSFNHKLNIVDFKKQLKKLKNLEPKTYIRGKFELWYLVNYLKKLTNILTTSNQPKSTRAMIKTQLTSENAIEIISGKIAYPKELNKFLDDNIC